MKKILLLGALLMSLTGCSAMMALGGEKEPDFAVIRPGQAKSIVESQPLKPEKIEQLSNGNSLATYRYTVGKEPSVGRAVVYVLLDSMTIFISEIFTMPIEMSKKGDTKYIQIEYNSKGEVVRVR